MRQNIKETDRIMCSSGVQDKVIIFVSCMVMVDKI
jgi:hypothetical protein